MPDVNTIEDLLLQRSTSSEPAYVHGQTGAVIRWPEMLVTAERWRTMRCDGPVGLALSDPLAMAENLVAGLAAGVLLAPMDPSAPARDTTARVAELGLSTLVTDGFGGTGVRVVRFGSRSALPDHPAQPAMIMASSGSTGRPKLVPLTLDQLVATAGGVADHLGLTPGERGYSPLPLFHINGIVVGLLSSLMAGSTVIVDDRFSRRHFWRRAEEHGATWLNLVPAILAILGTAEQSGGPVGGRVRLARSASAPLSAAVLRRFEARYDIPIVETYGMTEAASQITANPLPAVRPGSVGLPVDVEVRVVDGRVQIRGTRVSTTYWAADGSGRLLAHDAARPDGWLTTGDLGQIDEDGYLYLTGRESEIINRGGEKIRPREVEDVLLGDERVRVAAVVGQPHPTLGEELVAYVQADSGWARPAWPTLVESLARRCREQLAGYKRPASIVVADQLPVGPTGKVRRTEIRSHYEGMTKPTRRTGQVEEKGGDSLWLDLPPRQSKPRQAGLTMVIDSGQPHGYFADAIETSSAYVDLVKFGWGTALVTRDLERKLEVLNRNGIGYYFGGTLFEKFAMQDRFPSFLTLCRLCDCTYVEVSNGTVGMSEEVKARYISQCADAGFTVISEVGFKDPGRSEELTATDWVEAIRADRAAGASLVITESRESGRSGICRADGTPRDDVVDAILDGGIDVTKLMFEAATKDLQTQFIGRVGSDVNLGNIALDAVIGLETLRLGLRSDTLFQFEEVKSLA
jgi:phosphosulfolactate synthase (CoM biosynthesis protein A)/acyl-coenzyme A synthetase/AMP-(fatty) acid ligase